MSNQNPFQNIFEASVEAILAVNKQGNIILSNPSCSRLFGYSEEEFKSMKIEELIPKELRTNHIKNRANYNKDPKPRTMGKGRYLAGQKKDGSVFPIEVSLSQGVINEVDVTIAFVIDITARKKAEEALKKSEEKLIIYATQLEKKVSERTSELDEAIQELKNINDELAHEVTIRKQAEEETRRALAKEKELNELKSRFVSMASHEFRTPLATILSSASLISRYEEEVNAPKREKHIKRIKSNVGNLTNLLNDFLSLEKLEKGKITANFTEFNFCDLIQEVIEEIEPLLKPGQQIRFENSASTSEVFLDKTMSKNILLNLSSNAIKYSAQGEIILTLSQENLDSLQLTVSDQGIGIPDYEFEHMFERFFRAKNASNIQGTGLGLYIVKKYVEELGGSITFTSKLDVGTTFIITLPINYDQDPID